jgi:hypothetical protein
MYSTSYDATCISPSHSDPPKKHTRRFLLSDNDVINTMLSTSAVLALCLVLHVVLRRVQPISMQSLSHQKPLINASPGLIVGALDDASELAAHQSRYRQPSYRTYADEQRLKEAFAKFELTVVYLQ